MKLYVTIILGAILQILAVSASAAEHINPDTANALDCFFWYVENGGLEVACVQTAANLGCYDLANVMAALF